ncbi:endonuclease/exonuclease/phosphatase family protein [Mycobacterium sp. MS1601]|uniref:endonuclease/exonuclease/phosphatase family protein n=1 Tax=Mycobacterium sp. MS1601 TaxID=1936029 RepID=UPI001F1E5D26|nr:endonuclease/exonuclease/phosphatase family protein [Mycobacterium sp. MS1601]
MFAKAVGLVTLGVACWGLAARYVPATNHLVLLSAVLAPYLLMFAPLAALLLAIFGRRMFVVALVVTLVAVAVMVPLYRSSKPGQAEHVVRVMSANVYGGYADPADLVKSAAAQADVLAVQELTPEFVENLTVAGIDAAFPHRWLDPRDGASGSGLWSRYPLSDTRRIDGFSMAFLSARIELSGSVINPMVLVVHLPGPWPQPIGEWRHDMDRLPATLSDTADQAGDSAVIVAGDFNSSLDVLQFRALLRNGYRDAAEQSGAGFTPTYPAHWPLPPAITIDHILTRNCTATSLHTIRLPGSDHRGIISSVALDTPASNPRKAVPPG